MQNRGRTDDERDGDGGDVISRKELTAAAAVKTPAAVVITTPRCHDDKNQLMNPQPSAGALPLHNSFTLTLGENKSSL